LNETSSLHNPGTLVGSYKLLRLIAQGPFGPLYELRAEPSAGGLAGLGRLLAVPADLPPETLQIVSEAAWESLEVRHEQALCVADVVFGTGWVMLVHDHAEGTLLRSLQRRCQESKTAFPVGVALRVILDVLDALDETRAACESSGVTWTPGGQSATSLYLCGNGRTRSLDGQLPATLLRTPSTRYIANSVGFPPPELLDGSRTPDERSDVFAAGTVLWELLAGRELSIGTAILRGERPRPNVARLELSMPKGGHPIPPSMLEAVHAAVELAPENRLPTCSALREALKTDVEAASYAQVIDFTDSLLNRESTLFRLNLAAGPRLSDEKRADIPKAPKLEWVVELAKQAQSKPTSPGPLSSRAPPKPPLRSSRPPPGMTDAPKPTEPTQTPARVATVERPFKRTTTQQSPSDPKNDRGLMKRTLLGLSPPTAAASPTTTSTSKPAQVTVTTKSKNDAAGSRPAKPKTQAQLSRTLIGVKPASIQSNTLRGLTAPTSETQAPPVAAAPKPEVPAGLPDLPVLPVQTNDETSIPTVSAEPAEPTNPIVDPPDEPGAPSETSNAFSLLNAELGQAAVESGPSPEEPRQRPGGVPLVDLSLAEPAKSVAEIVSPESAQRSRIFQFSLTTVILGLIAAVGLTVLTTVLILRSGSGTPTVTSAAPDLRVSAPTPHVASSQSPPAASSAASASPEANASDSTASAALPSSTASAEAAAPPPTPEPSSDGVVTTPTTQAKPNAPVTASPAPAKPSGRKRRTQYVPSGL
jgi:hypothetical protein